MTRTVMFLQYGARARKAWLGNLAYAQMTNARSELTEAHRRHFFSLLFLLFFFLQWISCMLFLYAYRACRPLKISIWNRHTACFFQRFSSKCTSRCLARRASSTVTLPTCRYVTALTAASTLTRPTRSTSHWSTRYKPLDNNLLLSRGNNASIKTGFNWFMYYAYGFGDDFLLLPLPLFFFSSVFSRNPVSPVSRLLDSSSSSTSPCPSPHPISLLRSSYRLVSFHLVFGHTLFLFAAVIVFSTVLDGSGFLSQQ